MSPARVALLPLCSGPEPGPNLDAIAAGIAGLKDRGVAAVFTPENAACLGGPADYRRVAEPLGEGPVQARFAELARREGVWLAVGSFPIRAAGGGLRATSLLYDATGRRVAAYEKLHLFDVEVPGDRDGKPFRYAESDAYEPGGGEVLVDTPFGSLGLTICYDLRFPALFTSLRDRGAEVIAVPAAFTAVTGEAHWEVLLRARAIETQCFVLAAGQGGEHPDGRRTWGHSMAIDPWGRVLGVAVESGPLVVDLDRGMLGDVRARMPLREHARYRVELAP